eukprot:scaffold18912_cov96-Isochrysis_galbana.AAC.5
MAEKRFSRRAAARWLGTCCPRAERRQRTIRRQRPYRVVHGGGLPGAGGARDVQRCGLPAGRNGGPQRRRHLLPLLLAAGEARGRCVWSEHARSLREAGEPPAAGAPGRRRVAAGRDRGVRRAEARTARRQAAAPRRFGQGRGAVERHEFSGARVVLRAAYVRVLLLLVVLLDRRVEPALVLVPAKDAHVPVDRAHRVLVGVHRLEDLARVVPRQSAARRVLGCVVPLKLHLAIARRRLPERDDAADVHLVATRSNRQRHVVTRVEVLVVDDHALIEALAAGAQARRSPDPTRVLSSVSPMADGGRAACTLCWHRHLERRRGRRCGVVVRPLPGAAPTAAPHL